MLRGDRSSPIHLALSSTALRSFDAFSLLLEKGADVNEPDRNGATPLHLAAEKDDDRYIEALLARGVDVKKLDRNKQSPLHIAANKGNVKALEALLARGSDINGLCDKKKSPLHNAIEGEHDAAAEFLIANGAEVAMAEPNCYTPLDIAIRKSSVHTVKLLLAKGVDVGSADDLILLDAAREGNVEVIEALIAAGANPCTEHKTPPWFVAARHDKKEAVPILLAHYVASVSDASMMLQKQYSENLIPSALYGGIETHGNVFHWACLYGDVKSVSLLMKMGANVNDTNCTRGRIPLHFAAEGNHAALIKYLVSNGADIQANDSYGWSPLHSAAVYGTANAAIVALVDLGADLSVKTNSGKTPLASYKAYTFDYNMQSEIISLLGGKK